ncbi:MAG: tyrosine-type recombinase/integrase [Methanomassiliicoccales archaeon]
MAKSSLEQLKRKARYLNKVFADLRRSGRISTSSPHKMSESDIREIIKWMSEQGHQNSYKVKNLGFIRDICQYAGNNVFAKMKADGIRLPNRTPKDLNPMAEDDLQRILQVAEGLKGWSGEVTRFLVWMYPYTGLRASELRQAHLVDLDAKTWTIKVRHPKGENRYARQRVSTVLPPARGAVLRFLDARKVRLANLGIDSEALIPAYHGGFYSSTGFRRMKAELEKKVFLDLGVRITFTIKDFRAIFCQQNIDRGVKTESVSVAMGHSSTKTTETYYGRMRTPAALSALNDAWDSKSNTRAENPRYQKDLIDKEIDYTGYA